MMCFEEVFCVAWTVKSGLVCIEATVIYKFTYRLLYKTTA